MNAAVTFDFTLNSDNSINKINIREIGKVNNIITPSRKPTNGAEYMTFVNDNSIPSSTGSSPVFGAEQQPSSSASQSTSPSVSSRPYGPELPPGADSSSTSPSVSSRPYGPELPPGADSSSTTASTSTPTLPPDPTTPASPSVSSRPYGPELPPGADSSSTPPSASALSETIDKLKKGDVKIRNFSNVNKLINKIKNNNDKFTSNQHKNIKDLVNKNITDGQTSTNNDTLAITDGQNKTEKVKNKQGENKNKTKKQNYESYLDGVSGLFNKHVAMDAYNNYKRLTEKNPSGGYKKRKKRKTKKIKKV
jgi:hypothetical protein